MDFPNGPQSPYTPGYWPEAPLRAPWFKPIDKVTIPLLDATLKACGVKLDRELIDLIIDLVEILEKKGDLTTLRDIAILRTKHPKF